jgi:hypothetical protein
MHVIGPPGRVGGRSVDDQNLSADASIEERFVPGMPWVAQAIPMKPDLAMPSRAAGFPLLQVLMKPHAAVRSGVRSLVPGRS